MKNLFIAVMALSIFASCNNASKSKSENETKSAETCVATVCVDSFLIIAPDNVGKEISIKGTVDHVCKHGGKKVKVYSSCPSKSMHGVATESLGVFEADIEGSDICMTGVVAESRMTMDDIHAWEVKIEEAKSEKGEGCDDHKASEQKIQKHREMIEKSDSGYIAFYHLDVASYKVCETVSSDSALIKTECCHKVDSATCAKKKEKGECCKQKSEDGKCCKEKNKECKDKEAKKEGKCCDKKEKKDSPEKE